MNTQRSKLEQFQASEIRPVTNTWLPALSILVNEMLRCWCAYLGQKAPKHIWETMKYLSGLWERSKGGCSAGFYSSVQQPTPCFFLMWQQRPNIRVVDRYVPGSSIPSAVPYYQHLHWCLQVWLWCSAGRGLRDEAWGISYRQKKNLLQQNLPRFGFLKSSFLLTCLLEGQDAPNFSFFLMLIVLYFWMGVLAGFLCCL